MSSDFVKKYPTEKTEEEKRREKLIEEKREELQNRPIDWVSFPDGWRDK